MANRIKPMDYDRSEQESLGPQRNDRMVKHAQRQVDYENQGRDPRRSILKESEMNPDAKPSPSMEGFGGIRIDAVVIVVLFIEVLGIVAAGVAIYVYGLDQDWNSVLTGQGGFPDIDEDDNMKDRKAFMGKTLRLSGHLYLEKAVEYARRDEFQELIFIIYILGFVLASFVQMFLCYVKAADVEKNAIILIAMYSVGGGFCIYSSTFLISASVNIENSYTYAAEMLHNFQHLSTDEPISSKDQDRCQKEYKNGCDYYEYAKLQANALEQIFRVCGSGSRFTKHYSSKDDESTTVDIEDEIYEREDLKKLGFCSRDGYKFAAAIFAVFMGVLCSIVPILFCCEGRSRRREDYADIDMTRGIRKSRGGTPMMQQMPQDRRQSAPPPQEEEKYDQSAVLDQFRKYVERNSSAEEEQDS